MLILVGPSASGKTQIVQILRNEYGLNKMVTYTSRSPRVGEVDGIDYHFLTKEEFEKKIKEEFFIEYVVYNGNYYGTAKTCISNDKVVILEPSGIKHYLEKVRDEVTVVFLRCSNEIVRIRMKQRGDSLEVIEKRLILDKEVFNKEIIELCDFVVDTSASNVYANAKEIYLLYKEYMK